MKTQPDLDPSDLMGDFDALLAQLDKPTDIVVVDGGYASLMARINSADYRRRCAGEKS